MTSFTGLITCPSPGLNIANRPLIGWTPDGTPVTVDDQGHLTRVDQMGLPAEDIRISPRTIKTGAL